MKWYKIGSRKALTIFKILNIHMGDKHAKERRS